MTDSKLWYKTLLVTLSVAGRGCVDMVFCMRQLVEKTISKIFLLFVDLRTYDSVPRQALWCALRKYGVPDCLIDLVCSFHDGIVATVACRWRGSTTFPGAK